MDKHRQQSIDALNQMLDQAAEDGLSLDDVAEMKLAAANNAAPKTNGHDHLTATKKTKPQGPKPEWKKYGYQLTEKGSPIMNLRNAIVALQENSDFKGHFWYDEFLDSILTDWDGPMRQWADVDDISLCAHLQNYTGLTRISVEQAHNAAHMAAFRNKRNECLDWQDGLQWDGTERLAYLMSDGFGAQHDAYGQAVGRCWMVSMVARVQRPGCKVDTVPVLEGGQGIGKSTGLSILGGKWFSEGHESVMSKDFFGVLNGHMLVEISEMHSFTRVEVERIKGIISCQVDRYRKAYGKNTQNHPRQTVLVCTTNRDDWQRDDTGARRFWPIACGEVDLNWLRQNRDQLFAEAVHIYKLVSHDAGADLRLQKGAAWWDVPVDEQQKQVEQRRDVDSWENLIAAWLLTEKNPTTSDILLNCLKIEVGQHDPMRQRRVARVMRVLQWKQKVARDGNRILRVWFRPENAKID